MIKLEKKPQPNILKEKHLEWTRIVEEKIAKGEKPTDTDMGRYRHPEIKQALIDETDGKCAYCESKLLHVAYGDVEHILPKSAKAENLYEWSNLTLACDRCNTNKAQYKVIDPYVEDPEDAFEFLGPMVFPDPSQSSAVFSEKCLQLNRPQLIERRTAKLKYLSDQLLILSKAKNSDVQEVLKRDLLENETSATQEFSASARSFIKLMLPKVLEKLATSSLPD